MTPIRAANLSAPPAPATAVDAARLAAQRAFFEVALGKPAAASASAAAAEAAPTPIRTADLRPGPAAEPPARILRPGSLLDIRI